MKTLKMAVLLAAILALAGCTTISLTCPDGISTVSYKGTNVLSPAATTASCLNSGTGPIASVSGVDLSQLEAAVMSGLAASGQLPIPVAKPTAIPTPAPSAVPTP
jgi:hypothetical protein